jgi:Ca-activated chloride channel family protein
VSIAAALCVFSGFARFSQAQGLIVDRRAHVPIARAYEVREVSVDARIREQVAEVQVSQTFHNPGSFALEAEYLFPLPDDGAIQSIVLMVDGKELPGRLLPKDEARRIYEEVVRTKRDPALLEYMGRGLYRTSVFPIPPGADRKVTMRYTQLARRERDVVEFAYPLATQKFTAKPIDRLTLSVDIRSGAAIKSLYSPSHEVAISRTGDREALVKMEQRNVVPTADFRLLYTLTEGAIGATVLSYRPSDSEDGFFLLLASPQVKRPDARPQPKTVIFVLDRSGSMTGRKIEQAKKALQFVLDNLRDGDTFNIVAYDDRVETFKPELQRYTPDTRSEATRFVDNIHAGGSTNIDGALKTAMAMIADDTRPSYVLFMTDGLPTAGEVRETAISENCRSANKQHARLFAFGVGFDVNARLLDRLSGGNSGTSEYVRPDQDIEAHVSRFYAKMTSPALSAIQIELAGTDVNRTYPRDVPDLFEGGQLVWVGRYRQPGKTTVRISGKVAGERQSFEFPAELTGSDRGSTYDFVEKLWAVRRIGYIIDQIDLNGQNKELTDELVMLSTKHGILTPYTSFLADERVRLHAAADNFRLAEQELEKLREVSGASGQGQRAGKQLFLGADRFSAAAPSGTVARREAGAGGGGRGGLSVNAPALAVKDAEGRESLVTTVRQVGKKTFFRKDGRWLDADVKEEEVAKAIVLEQFSEDYFKLVRSQSAELNQYLSLEDAVLVKLADKVYRIEQARGGER